MSISRTLFELMGSNIPDSEVPSRLREALIDTLAIETVHDRCLTGELWAGLAEYDRGDRTLESLAAEVK